MKDFSDLAIDVTDLKEDLNNIAENGLYHKLSTLTVSDFEIGAWNTDGKYLTANHRVRTKLSYHLMPSESVQLTISNGYKAIVRAFNAELDGTTERTQVSTTDWQTASNVTYTAQSECWAIVTIGNTADSTITVSDAVANVLVKVPEEIKTHSEQRIDILEEAIESLQPSLPDDIKNALLACFRNVAWANESGKTYYDDLYSLFYHDEDDPIPEVDGFTFHDYIMVLGNGDNIQTPYRSMIKTGIYENLNNLSIDVRFKPITGISGNSAAIGGRTINASSIAYSVAVYCIPNGGDIGTTIYTHGKSGSTTKTITTEEINRIKVTPGKSSPTQIDINGNFYTIDWASGNFDVNSSIHLFGNITEGTNLDTNVNITPKLQVGRIIVRDINGNKVGDFVPAVRDSDHVIGLYDIYNNTGAFPVSGSYAQIGNSKCINTVGDWE